MSRQNLGRGRQKTGFLFQKTNAVINSSNIAHGSKSVRAPCVSELPRAGGTRHSYQPFLTTLAYKKNAVTHVSNIAKSSKERVLYLQLTGPDPLYHRDDLSRPALRHRNLNSHFPGSLIFTFLTLQTGPRVCGRRICVAELPRSGGTHHSTTSLCTGERNAIRNQKYFICISFYGRACR